MSKAGSKWSKRLALERLGIEQEPYKPPPFVGKNDGVLHGYAYGNRFAVHPDTPFAGAAGFHEISHIVLGHTFATKRSDLREECLHELEACASAILALKAVGAKKSGIDAQREHYLRHRLVWQEMERHLPRDFKKRVNKAALEIQEAGGLEPAQRQQRPDGDLSPEDLGLGLTLKFQRSVRADTVRAVVIAPDGSFWAKGPVVSPSDAFASRAAAVRDSRRRTASIADMNAQRGVVLPDEEPGEEPDVEPDEDEDDEDQTEE